MVIVAPMQNFNLTQHLIKKFILNFLEDWSIDKFSRTLLICLLICSVVFAILDEVNVLHLEDLAAWALFLCDSLAILVSNLELAEEAYDLVAIVAFFGFDWNLLAHHAGRFFDELLLEFIHWNVGVPWQENLDLQRRELALRDDAVYLVV